ncbi:Rap1 GTPase-GDP dissociation stimulator 1 [Acropora cervicornis]|uniref:Rap1 GTPase-GDP dissociation stimulator 1 n=1 Tax=Acropora cervicornis TaxID=6130 RepID=A0AAD9QFW4_ACRCE|nr:Rap1 GTPase-GDP dissociation stimulator 1 [Acropora cervicornis]
MKELSELLQKLKLDAEQTKTLDFNVADSIITALQSKQDPLDDTTIEGILEMILVLLAIDHTPRNKAKVLMLIAEIAKSEETRVPCVKAGLISTLLSHLESEELSVVLQALRAIGNISYENEQAKSVLLECQGAEKIVKKLGDLEKNFDEKSDNRIELAACGSLLNVASDDGALADEAVSFGAISFLFGFVKQSVHSNPNLCQMALSALSVLVSSDKGKESFLEGEGVAILRMVLEESDDDELIDLGFEIVTSLILDDNVKKALVKQGYTEYLLKVVSSLKDEKNDELAKQRVQSSADIIVMLLTEDESMKVLFGDGNGAVLKAYENCIKLVEIGAHEKLLDLLARTSRSEDPGRRQQAVFSALKNLSMPASNKVKLVESGCLDVILPLLSTSPFVQFKVLEISEQVIKFGGLTPIIEMFRDSGLIQTLIKLIKTQGINPQTCYNAMAVLESFSLKEYFHRDLEVAGLNKALDDLTSHDNANVKKRALIILTRIKAQKIAQQD